MDYIKNEHGDIKVIGPKGKVKWFSLPVVNDAILMRDGGFIIAKAPVLLTPIAIEEVTESGTVKVDGRRKQK